MRAALWALHYVAVSVLTGALLGESLTGGFIPLAVAIPLGVAATGGCLLSMFYHNKAHKAHSQ